MTVAVRWGLKGAACSPGCGVFPSGACTQGQGGFDLRYRGCCSHWALEKPFPPQSSRFLYWPRNLCLLGLLQRTQARPLPAASGLLILTELVVVMVSTRLMWPLLRKGLGCVVF